MYYVASNVTHDGRAYKRGETIENADISDENAVALIELGVLSVRPVEAPKPQASQPPEEVQSDPKVGGERSQSGEPSIDNQDSATGSSDAKDVTPPTDTSPAEEASQPTQQEPENPAEPNESMTRAALDQMAAERGIPQEAIEAASNKAAVIELIKNGVSAAEPEHDPSKDL